jgi:hypothetical protein
MRPRLLPTLAGLAVAVAVPVTAHAQPQQGTRGKARVYVAALKPVRSDIRDYSAMTARATIRVRPRGRIRARIFIRARALAPRRHPWQIVNRRCRGRRLRGWTYNRGRRVGVLRPGPRGRARARGRARRFTVPRRPRRYVVVYQPGTRVPLLCGRVRARRAG